MRKKILFICTYNSVRSQMAEGLLRGLYGDRYEAYSAGIHPSGINPHAVRVMSEFGIDISGHRSKSINEFRGVKFDCVVTICDQAKETCPFLPEGKRLLHRGFKDPAAVRGKEEEVLEVFRRTRDELKDWIEQTFGKGAGHCEKE